MKHYSSLIALACIAQGLTLSAHEKDCQPFYVRIEGGKSFSQKADIKVNENYFDPAPEGYNAKIGSAAVFGAGVGYNVTNWLSTGFSANYRSKYDYEKHQTAVTTNSTPDPLGDKTRYFNLDNTSFLFDVYFNRTGSSSPFSLTYQSLTLAPFIGASIGLSKNTLYNFHTVLDNTLTNNNLSTHQVESILSDFVKHSFAWQISLGLDITLCKDVTIGLAYRYFDGGTFETNNYTLNQVAAFDNQLITVPAWTGKLKAHEVIANFTINF